jgi:hypothetical protein
VTVNLKIEILKIFCLEFGFSSEKKEKEDDQKDIDLLDIFKQPGDSK